MCVVSMVMDHYRPVFYPYIPPQTLPFRERPALMDPEFVKERIREFKESLEAAEKVDRLTGQPDCEDPEKAKLKEQVDRLEKVVDRLLAELEQAKAAQ